MGLIYILTAVFILANLSQGSLAQNADAFREFLISSMAHFPAWLQAKNYDPTPILPNPVNLTYLEYDESYGFSGAVKNQRFSGLAGPATYNANPDSFERDFTLAIFYTEEASRNMTVEGEYNAIGFLRERGDNVIPIIGSGKMYLSDQIRSFYIQLNCKGFGITPDGFVDLSQADISYTLNSPLFRNATLEGLRANGWEDVVTLTINREYSKFNERNLLDWLPLGGYMREYLDEVFASISYDDIIKLGYQPK